MRRRAFNGGHSEARVLFLNKQETMKEPLKGHSTLSSTPLSTLSRQCGPGSASREVRVKELTNDFGATNGAQKSSKTGRVILGARFSDLEKTDRLFARDVKTIRHDAVIPR